MNEKELKALAYIRDHENSQGAELTRKHRGVNLRKLERDFKVIEYGDTGWNITELGLSLLDSLEKGVKGFPIEPIGVAWTGTEIGSVSGTHLSDKQLNAAKFSHLRVDFNDSIRVELNNGVVINISSNREYVHISFSNIVSNIEIRDQAANALRINYRPAKED